MKPSHLVFIVFHRVGALHPFFQLVSEVYLFHSTLERHTPLTYQAIPTKLWWVNKISTQALRI